jgi:hypothetical protein
MRGAKEKTAHGPPALPRNETAANDETVALLLAIRDELRQTRELLQVRADKGSAGDPHV